MTACEKCSFDPEKDLCPFCGVKNQTVGNFGGKFLTICCRKDPNKTARGGK
jgi:RNA polymerase subunit RPABC4/transcription elongation factor Spt4